MNNKTFTIDWDSYDDVVKLGNIIKSRLGELNPNTESKRSRNRLMLEACDRIYRTDISQVYQFMNLDSTPKFYVYAHLNPMLNIAVGVNAISTFAATLGMSYRPMYIGKGTGARFLDLNRNGSHRKMRQKVQSNNLELVPFKIADGLTELEALCLESKLIDIFQLITHGGTLTNLDEGVNPEDRRNLYLTDYQLLTLRHSKRIIKE